MTCRLGFNKLRPLNLFIIREYYSEIFLLQRYLKNSTYLLRDESESEDVPKYEIIGTIRKSQELKSLMQAKLLNCKTEENKHSNSCYKL